MERPTVISVYPENRAQAEVLKTLLAKQKIRFELEDSKPDYDADFR